MLKRQRLVSVLTAGALAAGLAACAPGREAVPEHVQEQVLSVSTPSSDVNLAINRVWDRCMRSAGFDVPPGTGWVLGSTPALVALDGLFSTEQQARAGYPTTVNDVDDNFVSALTDGQRAAYEVADMGPEDGEWVTLRLEEAGVEVSVPAEGCAAEARMAVYGNLQDAMTVENYINTLLGQSQSALDEAQSAVEDAAPAYEDCMSSNNYALSFPEAGNFAREKFGQYRTIEEDPSAAEVDLALQDLACQEESGLIDGINGAYFDSAANWIQTHEDEILGISELRQVAEQRSKEIINKPS